MSQKVDQVDVSTAVEKHPEAENKSVKEKKKKAPKEKKPKSDKVSHPAHPPYFQMIKEALLALNERGGSSPHAIAKYMEDKHKDVLPANYKKMLGVQLKNCVANDKLIKIKASFKLSDASKKEKKAVPKTGSVKSVGEKTKKRKKPTTSTKPKSTAAAVVPKKKTAVAAPKKKTAVAAPKKKIAVAAPKKKIAVAAPKKKIAVAAPKKKIAVAAKKVAATPTKKTGPAKKVVPGKKTKRATPVKAKQPKSIKSPAAKRAKKATAA